jgi:hypothetical protein
MTSKRQKRKRPDRCDDCRICVDRRRSHHGECGPIVRDHIWERIANCPREVVSRQSLKTIGSDRRRLRPLLPAGSGALASPQKITASNLGGQLGVSGKGSEPYWSAAAPLTAGRRNHRIQLPGRGSPGDEQEGARTRERLVEMDRQFRLRVERTFRHGTELREERAGAPSLPHCRSRDNAHLPRE